LFDSTARRYAGGMRCVPYGSAGSSRNSILSIRSPRRCLIRRWLPWTVLFLLPVAATGEGLSETYRSWDKSPEAYFLTAEERASWKNVKTDEQAEKFVADYFAARDLLLPSVLEERIAIADKSFSSGKVKGSQTLNGKIVIVFGLPSRLQVRRRGLQGGVTGSSGDISYTSALGFDPLINAGPGGGGLRSATSAQYPVLEIIYDEKAAPKAIGHSFTVRLFMKSETVQEPVDPADFEQKVEAMARATLKAPPARP
jgi:GWxTD domain-containing protein